MFAPGNKRHQSARLVLVPVLFIVLSALGAPGLFGAEDFTFSSDRMSTIIAKGRERTLLSGNARIVSDTTEITAEEIELFGDESRYALCYGNVTVIDDEKGIKLTCDELFYDREIDLSRIDGYSEMIDQKNEIVVKGGFLEHFGDDDITIVQIGVRILKEEMACRSEFARYKREEDLLELSGMPYVYWKGDEYRASRIIINLDTDEIRLEGEVTGTITTEDEEEGEGGQGAEGPGPGGETSSGEASGTAGSSEQGTEISRPQARESGDTGPANE